MTEIKPTIKWLGGKRQLMTELVNRMPSSYGRYYEPFVGGGALLFKLQPDGALINDENKQLINMYIQIRDNVEDLILKINEYDAVLCDVDYFKELRSRYNQKILKNELDVDCGALFIWLNKHLFNGSYKLNKKGLLSQSYNYRTHGSSIMEDNLRAMSQYLKYVTICSEDFEVVCSTVKSGDFVYFDPPYLSDAEHKIFNRYTKDGFSFDDQKRLADLVHRLTDLGVKVIVSNSDIPMIHELYKDFRIDVVNVHRFVNGDATHRTGTEVIIMNY